MTNFTLTVSALYYMHNGKCKFLSPGFWELKMKSGHEIVTSHSAGVMFYAAGAMWSILNAFSQKVKFCSIISMHLLFFFKVNFLS